MIKTKYFFTLDELKYYYEREFERCDYIQHNNRVNKDYKVLFNQVFVLYNPHQQLLTSTFDINKSKFVCYKEYFDESKEQIDFAVNLLKHDSSTRQAIVCMINRENRFNPNKIPCLMIYNFYIFHTLSNEDKLCVNVFVRSCDFDKKFKNDVLYVCYVLKELGEHLNLKLGKVTFFVTNLHSEVK